MKILKTGAMLLIILILALGIIYLFLPTGPREQMEFDDPYHVPRSTVEGEQFMVSTGTRWGTAAAKGELTNVRISCHIRSFGRYYKSRR